MSRLSRFKKSLLRESRVIYESRLVTLAIFGSWARGTATPVSDIDLLVVAEPLVSGRGNRTREFEAVEIATEPIRRTVWAERDCVVDLSPLIKTPEEVVSGSPLFLDMTLWCEILADRERFFAQYLERLRARMLVLGSRRCEAKGGYYWEYKPDLKPGEIVEL